MCSGVACVNSNLFGVCMNAWMNLNHVCVIWTLYDGLDYIYMMFCDVLKFVQF